MMGRSFRLLLVPAAAALFLAANGPWAHTVVGQDDERAHARNRILDHAMEIEAGRVQRMKYERPLSSGVIYAAREAAWEMEGRDAADTGADPATSDLASGSIVPPPSFQRTQGCQNVFVR